MTRATLILLLGSVLAAGCGDDTAGPNADDFIGSCDLRKALGMCSEYERQTAAEASKLQMSCALVGQWSSARCTREAVIAGCRTKHTENSGDLIAWYYPGGPYKTAAEVQSFCTSKKGTFFPVAGTGADGAPSKG